MQLLLLLLLIGPFAAAQGEVDSPPISPLSQTLSNVRPLWALNIGRKRPARGFPGPRVASDEERIFYLQAGQLKAVDGKTGQQVWAFQIGTGARLKYGSGWLFASTRRKVYALEPQTGRVRWSKRDVSANFSTTKQALYVANPGSVRAFELKTGELLWHTKARYLQPTATIYNDAPLTVVDNRIFVQSVSSGAITTIVTYVYSARTGKRLSEAYSYGPLAAVADKVYFVVHNFPTQLDYPDRFEINVYSLQTGRLLKEQVYNVEGRVKDQNWQSRAAVADGAVYISGGGNIACFPLSQPGGDAKPDFIRVSKADVKWLAGPYDGTFLLEWQGALWLARQRQKNRCAPVKLIEQGRRLDSGTLARIKVTGNGMYLGLKNGTFYAINLQTGEAVLRLETNATFGPSHVVGDTLIVQAGNDLLAFALPKELSKP